MCVAGFARFLHQLYLRIFGEILLFAHETFGNVLKDGALEEDRLLLNEPEVAPQPLRVVICNVFAVQENLTGSLKR